MRNILGFAWGIGGADFAYRACEQAWLFGANMVFSTRAVGLRTDGDLHVVRTADGREVTARAVLLATGAQWRRLRIPRLEELIGAGVFYGAPSAEARTLRGRHACVLGGGNSAGQAASYLARFAESVTLLVRGDSVRAGMSAYLAREVEQLPNVDVRHETEVVDGEGATHLDAIVVRDRRTGELERVPTDALFVMIGADPDTGWLPGSIARDPDGYILTGVDAFKQQRDGGWTLTRPPTLLETSVPGVFAAGDVRHGSVKRVMTAVGEGAAAVQVVHAYFEETGATERGDRPRRGVKLGGARLATG
jgi:thioredoxin reductase (NADPH)